MRNLVLFLGLVTFLAVPSFANVQANNDDDEPKYEIGQVMKDGMKGGLLRKVASGQANEEETKMMMEMVASLKHYEPTKGSEESWKEKSEALEKALKGFIEGEDGAAAALRMASNCMACHQAHKPKADDM